MAAPKLFISYSWSNREHEQWVVDLATQLRESAVDVILDKWDLKEGHDAVKFMEQMVTDPEIKKVAMICDHTYAAKADNRAGGVGTETQIISREVYEKQDQDKFVAIVSQKDEDGKPYLPTYYKSRIYIDLSAADTYSENFERLLRWIFDKPLYVKPELGSMPTLLSEGEHISLGTTAAFKRSVDAIRNGKPYAAGAFDEYCNSFASNLERFRLSNPDGEFDDAVATSIEEFLPHRNEAIQLFLTIAQYLPTPDFAEKTHRFLESLIPYLNEPTQTSSPSGWASDNFKFFIHELFLYALATFLKKDWFEGARYLLEQHYYIGGNYYGEGAMVSYPIFRQHLRSLAYRNERLKLKRLSVTADLLHKRCNGMGIEFRHLMQADFIAFLRAEVEKKDDSSYWWPETLLYVGRFNGPFEVFGRSQSVAYFNRVKGLLAIDSPKDLEPLLESYRNGTRNLPRWEFESFNPPVLLGYKYLATRP